MLFCLSRSKLKICRMTFCANIHVPQRVNPSPDDFSCCSAGGSIIFTFMFPSGWTAQVCKEYNTNAKTNSVMSQNASWCQSLCTEGLEPLDGSIPETAVQQWHCSCCRRPQGPRNVKFMLRDNILTWEYMLNGVCATWTHAFFVTSFYLQIYFILNYFVKFFRTILLFEFSVILYCYFFTTKLQRITAHLLMDERIANRAS